MPYILINRLKRSERSELPHHDFQLPNWHVRFASKAEALARRVDPELVHYAAADGEIFAYHDRERQRIAKGEYQLLPDWFPRGPGNWFSYLDPAGDVIRFFPDHAHGHEDRRIALTPARFVKRLVDNGHSIPTQWRTAPHRACERLARWHKGDHTWSLTDQWGPVRYATTADEIAAIYCAPNSPASCMDGRHFSFGSSPTRAYGGSDLSFAWLGELADPDDSDDNESVHSVRVVHARAVLWQARNLYGRIYPEPETGNAGAALHDLLDQAGMAQIGNGGFAGAKIRLYNGMCPYIDWHKGAVLSADGKSLTLVSAAHADAGLYSHNVQRTGGTATRTHNSQTCQHDGCTGEAWGAMFCADHLGEQIITCSGCAARVAGSRARPAGPVGNRFNHVCDGCRRRYLANCVTCGTDFCRLEHGNSLYQSRSMHCPDCYASGRVRP